MLLLTKYMVQIVYSNGIPYDDTIEKYRFDRFQSKANYDIMKDEFELGQDILKIIFEFTDEYYDEIRSRSSLIMNLEMTIANEDHSDTEEQDLKLIIIIPFLLFCARIYIDQ